MPYAEALSEQDLLAYHQADLCCGIPPAHLDWRWREAAALKGMSRRGRDAAVQHPRIAEDYFLLRCLDYQLAAPKVKPELYPDFVGAEHLRNHSGLRERAEAILLAYNGLSVSDLRSDFSRETVTGLNVVHLTCYRATFFDISRYHRMNGVVLQMLGGDLFDASATDAQLLPGHQIAVHLGMAGVKAWLGRPLSLEDSAELNAAMTDAVNRRQIASLIGVCRPTPAADPAPASDAAGDDLAHHPDVY